MSVEAIKQSIQALPEADRRALAAWFDAEFPAGEDARVIHDQIGLGLAQLNRGEGIAGEVSRARLQEMKAAILAQQSPRMLRV
jgi:hypothetical protein